MDFALSRKVNGTIDEVETRVTTELKSVGFGILTRLEVDKILFEKIGETVAPYRILGACNPQLAHLALQNAPEVGVFLPCSVCLKQESDGVAIWALNPGAVAEISGNPELKQHSEQAQALIEKALNAV